MYKSNSYCTVKTVNLLNSYISHLKPLFSYHQINYSHFHKLLFPRHSMIQEVTPFPITFSSIPKKKIFTSPRTLQNSRYNFIESSHPEIRNFPKVPRVVFLSRARRGSHEWPATWLHILSCTLEILMDRTVIFTTPPFRAFAIVGKLVLFSTEDQWALLPRWESFTPASLSRSLSSGNWRKIFSIAKQRAKFANFPPRSAFFSLAKKTCLNYAPFLTERDNNSCSQDVNFSWLILHLCKLCKFVKFAEGLFLQICDAFIALMLFGERRRRG